MWRQDSASSIADRLAVSHTLVQKIRDELIRIKEIEPPEKVTTNDGRVHPAKAKAPATVAGAHDAIDDSRRFPANQAATHRRTESGPVAITSSANEPEQEETEAETEPPVQAESESEPEPGSELNRQIEAACREIEGVRRVAFELTGM